MSSTDVELTQAAIAGYMAACYDFYGRVNIHEYAERDGRWYLDVTISEPVTGTIPFNFFRREFGGRVITLTDQLGHDYKAWRALGPRAYDVLTQIRPYIDGPIDLVDFALEVFEFDEEEDDGD